MEEITTDRINLSKLCKSVDKINSDFDVVDIKNLIDEMMNWHQLDHKVFQLYFIQGLSMNKISKELCMSTKRVSRSIKKSIELIANNGDIIKKII